MNNKKSWAGAIVAGFLSTCMAVAAGGVDAKERNKNKPKRPPSAEESYKKECRNLLPEKAEFAIDGKTGEVLVNNGGDTPRQVASLTKLLSLMTVQEYIDTQPQITAETEAMVKPEILSYKGMEWTAQQKGKWKKRDFKKPWKFIELIKVTALKSYNDLMTALVKKIELILNPDNENAGYEELNQKFARRIMDLFKSRGIEFNLANTTGLPNEKNQVSLRDVAMAVKIISEQYPQLASILGQKSTIILGKEVKSSNPLFDVKDLPYDVDLGKTGYTCAVGFSLASEVTKGKEGKVIAVTVGGLNPADRLSHHIGVLAKAYRVKASLKPLQINQDEIMNVKFPDIELGSIIVQAPVKFVFEKFEPHLKPSLAY